MSHAYTKWRVMEGNLNVFNSAIQACIPGNKISVSCNGDLYICEKVNYWIK